jgi:hypothetical protein
VSQWQTMLASSDTCPRDNDGAILETFVVEGAPDLSDLYVGERATDFVFSASTISAFAALETFDTEKGKTAQDFLKQDAEKKQTTLCLLQPTTAT